MMMIVSIAASKRQIPIRCNGQITDDDRRKVKNVTWEVEHHPEMRIVRWMCGVKLKDRLPSKELREV